MERIRQALEQAEKDRLELRANSSPASQSEASVVNNQSGVQVPERLPKARFQSTRILDIEAADFEKHRLVAALPDHKLADIYRILRTRVLQSMNDNGWNALAVTSPATGAGKTLTAINLAISLAHEIDRTVLLADFDLREPSIHKYFDYEPTAGLSDYLFHNAPLEDILFSPSIDGLVVLPGRESIHNSSEMLRSPKMIALVEELKGRYRNRLIIFDLAPVLAIDDALAFSPYADAMLMVAESGTTKRDDLEHSLKLLRNTPIVGTLLNKAARIKTAS
jgi:protein-tyrosine kinase